MADVGRLADVSAQTVSRYFTGTSYVGADTRERIEAAVATLGYRPNHVARNLRVNRTHTIGVMMMGQLNYGSASVLSGLSAAARATRYSLFITHIEEDLDEPGAIEEARRTLDNFQSFQVDGIILSTPYPGSEQLLDGILDTLPVVAIAGLPLSTVNSAAIDSYETALAATRHLISLGHRRILHAGGPPNRNETYERERGYIDAMGESGLTPSPPVIGADWSAETGYAAGIAADAAAFTGVVAANDLIALGFLRAMRIRGLEAPSDFSIIGVDDMPDAAYFTPPLTTMHMDFQELGSAAFRMTTRQIESGERPERLVLPSSLVLRESTAPPPSRD
jgi:DNA-binding LacI/PurR family transcriptional regulator